MLRRLKWFIAGFNQQKTPKTKADAKLLSLPGEHHSSTQSRKSMLEAVHEVAIYIHRFHNLDLFQQGWYQIKITMRWEDSDYASSLGTPSRVVQYDAPDLGSDEALGVWKIDDTDHSFSSQPFRIRYARQDILLSVMISFNLSLGKFKRSSVLLTLLSCELMNTYNLQGPITSAVILKFELLYTPVLENGSNMQDSLDASPAAVHEFRIPPKALLGLHSYCPVHFDAFHAVLVDTSVHISLLKGGVHAMKKPRLTSSLIAYNLFQHVLLKQVFLVKAFLTSRASLLQELQNLSTAIDQTIELTGFASQHDETKFLAASAEVGMETANGSKIPNGTLDFSSDDLYSLQNDELYRLFHSLGDQMHYLWNTFLNFHRANKTKVLEHLRNSWAIDRRAEWSIWMVYSKVEMPHQSTRSEIDDSLYHGLRGKLPSSQAAAMRAELHRRSIAQMRVSQLSQRLHYPTSFTWETISLFHSYADKQSFNPRPSYFWGSLTYTYHNLNAPLHSPSGNSYFRNMDPKDTNGMLPEIDSSFSGNQQKGRVLKIAVFVHGFQACCVLYNGHHLDLRLVRNQWLLIDPKIEFLMSEVNEDKTSEDFRDMGLRLAQEVIVFVKKKMDKASRSGGLKNVKLSFVGHSIGNVIIRTALAESIMEPYHRYLNTYISQKTLESFKNIILLSSPQDGYVPYHSARMEMCQASSADYSKKGKLFLEMLNNCLDQIRSPSSAQRTFMRCDVNFDTSLQGRNLNTMIGRAAHIEFLESDIFAKFIMWSFPELFR
ncbi:protein of unknown function DUF676, lipase-like protein [Cynara cardunculus var. scolymus]|uniref:DUF676 domain-containing protein n=1 Tax=Cynara cardunculus var. scolymus TaxID=59895 RepID=A0A103Y0R0_CYNCS|nr:protein of unknown function DUF676, lipase-like protein [Cynara cardunculus var. scolymus]